MSKPWVGMCSTVIRAGCAASAGGSVKRAGGTDWASAIVGAARTQLIAATTHANFMAATLLIFVNERQMPSIAAAADCQRCPSRVRLGHMMSNVTEIKRGEILEIDGDPWQVTEINSQTPSARG